MPEEEGEVEVEREEEKEEEEEEREQESVASSQRYHVSTFKHPFIVGHHLQSLITHVSHVLKSPHASL